ncbi:MAG: hypothetical protein ACKVS9_06130 [Phycisphaerae bacterium]
MNDRLPVAPSDLEFFCRRNSVAPRARIRWGTEQRAGAAHVALDQFARGERAVERDERKGDGDDRGVAENRMARDSAWTDDDYRSTYNIAIEAWHAESERYWKAFATVLTLNVGLFAILGLRNSSPQLNIAVAVLGIAMCVFWSRLQRGYAGWVDDWEKRVIQYEERFPPLFRDRKIGASIPSTKQTAKFFPWLVGGCWVPVILFALNQLGGSPTPTSGSTPMTLNPSQTVFMLFFAIFWGALANVQPRWKAFQFPLCRCVRPQVWRRCALAIVLLNLVPLGYFLFLMWVLSGVSEGTTWRHLLLGIIPAFGVFGLYRFWLAAIEFSPQSFYKSKRVSDGDSSAKTDGLEQKYWHVEPIYRQCAVSPPDASEDRSLPVIDVGKDVALGNLLAGILYLLVVAIVIVLFDFLWRP